MISSLQIFISRNNNCNAYRKPFMRHFKRSKVRYEMYGLENLWMFNWRSFSLVVEWHNHDYPRP